MPQIQIESLLRQAIETGASDLYLSVNSHPTLKIHGALNALDTIVLKAEDVHQLLKSMTSEENLLRLDREGLVDFALTLPVGGSPRTFRINAAKELSGLALTLRLVSNKIPTPAQIGFGPQIIDLLSRPQGLILATGPTGSGKSTTLASFMDYHAKKLGSVISTVEQPIEYQIIASNQSPVSIVRQFEVPVHVHHFKDALRGILRQAPDVIMVGELRDFDTTEVALHAAETGHLVLSTLHTPSAAEAIPRLVNIFPPERQEQIKVLLGSTLLAVIAQRLLPRADRPGRVLAYEVLLQSSALPHLISKMNLSGIQQTMQTGKKKGMHLFDDHLLDLVGKKLITAEVALQFAHAPGALKGRLDSANVEDAE